MNKNYRQGIYEVQNKDKYLGDKNPRYLSSYEYRIFRYCDMHKDVLKWGSENVVVPYWNPVKERKARYMVDMYIEYRDKYGNIHKELLEIKPKTQTQPPKKGGRKKESTRQLEEATWIQNTAKWEAAKKYADERGWKFRLITEDNLFK
jgi:hypothetical protein